MHGSEREGERESGRGAKKPFHLPEWLRLGTVRKGTYFSLGWNGVDTGLLQDSVPIPLNLGDGAGLTTVDTLWTAILFLFNRWECIVSFLVELGDDR